MSSSAVTPVSTPTPVAVKPNAIQILEKELAQFIAQRVEAISRVHALEGAIQSTQHLIAVFKAEIAKAEAEASKVEAAVVADVKSVEAKVEAEAKTIETKVEAAVTKVETEVKSVVAAVEADAKKL